MLIHLQTGIEAVITALSLPIVNEKTVVAQLESKYGAQVQHMTDESSKAQKSESIAIISLIYIDSGFWTPGEEYHGPWMIPAPAPPPSNKKGHHTKSAQ